MNVKGLHHLAIATDDPEGLAAFYREVLGLKELRRSQDNRGLRSIWLTFRSDCEDESAGILMLERTEAPGGAGLILDQKSYHTRRQGLHFLAFRIGAADSKACREQLRQRHVPIIDESDYTIYFQDPDGNRVGLSWYPDQTAKT